MGALFSKPKEVKAPPVPDPVPIPVEDDTAGEFAKKEQQRKSGFKKTFLTGQLTPQSTGKKRVFGGGA